MPYKDSNDGSLPDYIKRQPTAIRAKWVQIFNTVYEENGEDMAFIVANKWLLRQRGAVAEAKSLELRRVQFSLDETGEFIKKSEDGEDYVSFVLTDVGTDSHGDSYSLELLEKWAKDINSGVGLIGDIDHEEYDKILATVKNPEEAKSMFKNKKGIAKGLQAIVDQGRLWVKAMIDKRYKKAIQKAGVSLEALMAPRDDPDSPYTAGDLLGFSFMLSGQAANPRAVVAA